LEQIPTIADKIVRGIKDYSTIGPQRAMNYVNAKPKPAEKPAEGPEN
jgi:hypothetical protein